MIKVKEGVKFDMIAPGGFLIIQALKQASRTLDLDLTITSGTDGLHSGLNDPHHRGEAYDIRTHDFQTDELKHKLVYIIGSILGPRFYATLESPNKTNEHIHIQVAKENPFDASDLIKRL